MTMFELTLQLQYLPQSRQAFVVRLFVLKGNSYEEDII